VQWLIPVIPVTGAKEMRRLVLSLIQIKQLARPYLKNKPSMVAYVCNPRYEGDVHRRIMFQDEPGQKEKNPLWKMTKTKKELEECLKW
jgi:hypothetical protein